MKKGFLLWACLLLLSGCAQSPAAETPAPEPTAAGTPAPTPTPVPTPSLAPTPESIPYVAPTPIPAEEWEDYEPCHLEGIGATLLLPKSWAGNYGVETSTWENRVTFHMCVKDYPAGEPGEPLEHNVSVFRVVSMPTEEFEEHHLEGMTTQEWRDSLTREEGELRMWNWLGERDGVTCAMWYNTSFQAAVDDAEKYALYRSMNADFDTYPVDSSAYFIFDTP